MNELTVAVITIFGTVASVSGVVAYVFNGTRKLIYEMHAATMEMHRDSELRHKEVMATLNRQHELMTQQHQDVVDLMNRQHELMTQQHQDVVELLKKGFGVATG